ncbi:MAG: site-2 protease family protein [Candidatus Methanoperedens sp.]|nr:site-2 protease family protein [Candidatus Methanoperedens sp.]
MYNHTQRSPVVGELAEKISPFFSVYEVQQQGDTLYFFVIPKADMLEVKEHDGGSASFLEPNVVFQKLWSAFAEKGYQFSFKNEFGEYILIASPFRQTHERIWINAVLALATFITTMVMGSFLFGADPISNPSDVVRGIPFTIAIMAVLGSHETGHYIVAKRHGMQTSLPYFIPFPSLVGTMGAVIRHRGPIPNRKALFDVGIAGPLIGLFVSIIVTIIGLLQPPVAAVPDGSQIQLGIPPLFEFIASIIPVADISVMHPIAFAGWVGMLVTALNLIPAGQLDGGHMLRAMIGERASHVSALMPLVLLIAGGYMSLVRNQDGSMWLFWGLLLVVFAAGGHPRPLNDDVPLGKGRMVLGIVTFILGLLCVTLVPFQVL